MVELVRSSCETWKPHGFPVRAAQPWKPLREASFFNCCFEEVSHISLTSRLFQPLVWTRKNPCRICTVLCSLTVLTIPPQMDWRFGNGSLSFHHSSTILGPLSIQGRMEWKCGAFRPAFLPRLPHVWAVQGSLQGCCWRTLEPQIVLFCFIDFCLLVFFMLVHFSGLRSGQSKWTPWFQIRPFQSFK